LSGSKQGSQSDSEFLVANERDSELEVSIRLKDGERAFAVEGFVLAGGETDQFTAGLHNADTEGDMSIAAKVLSPQKATYEQEGIPVGVPEYTINILSDSLDVIWVEN
jgi:hypothetical protein